MDMIEGIERLYKLARDLDEYINENISLESLKSIENAILDYELFFYLTKSKFIKSYKMVRDGFAGNIFGYILCLYLSDDTMINIMVKRDTFNHTFLLENKISIDTYECLEKLKKIYKDKYYVTELSINGPTYLGTNEKKFANKELKFRGLINCGLDGVNYEDIRAVEQNTIDKIP